MRPSAIEVRPALRHGQQGLSLIFTLMAVAAMGVSAAAMIRTVDSGSIAIGNMAFQHDTRRTADYLAEQAISWLESKAGNGSVLNGETSANGYSAIYSSDWSTLDFNGSDSDQAARIDWRGVGCPGFKGTCLTPSAEIDTDTLYSQFNNLVRESDIKGRYMILRLCDAADPDDSETNCARPPVTAARAARGERSNRVFYRIIVYAKGPRNTRAYTETMVHLGPNAGSTAKRVAWRELVD